MIRTSLSLKVRRALNLDRIASITSAIFVVTAMAFAIVTILAMLIDPDAVAHFLGFVK